MAKILSKGLNVYYPVSDKIGNNIFYEEDEEQTHHAWHHLRCGHHLSRGVRADGVDVKNHNRKMP